MNATATVNFILAPAEFTEEMTDELFDAILVDLGGAETNSEMAVELLSPEQQAKIVICDAPIVEGAVMAATEASGGATLDEVRAVAEELSP